MADRTSAEIFGGMFKILAKNPDLRNKEMAKAVYKEIFNYDFNQYQMNCDEALTILGLAKYDEDSVVYLNSSGHEFDDY